MNSVPGLRLRTEIVLILFSLWAWPVFAGIDPIVSSQEAAFRDSDWHRNPDLLTFLQRSGAKSLGIKAIQRDLLDEETVLLEYKLGDSKSYVWAITSSSVGFSQLPSRSVIASLVRDLRNSLIQSQQPAQRARVELVANQVSEMLLRPVAGQLKGKRRIALVLDGSLQGISFAVLPDPGDMRTSLLMSREIVVLPSASTLDALRRRQASRAPPPKTLAILADPVFAATDPRLASMNDRLLPSPSNVSRTAAGELANLDRLSSSRQEAQAISALVAKDQSLVALDFDATRELAMSPQLGQYRFLHFATHGVVAGSGPERSGLVFSQFDQAGRPQEGFLDTQAIRSLDLPADLVVLSACQTALGRETDSGLSVNLSQSFLAAGAYRVVASLWPVNDAATARFMSRFYQHLLQRGLSPAAALRQAQLEMGKDVRWSSPFYWAGFVLQGDWR